MSLAYNFECEKCGARHGEDLTCEQFISGVSSLKRGNPEISARFNEGKVQTRELYPDFILGMGQVLTKSRAKYEEGNWMKETKYSTPYESLQRHLAAFWSGEDFDKESELHHLLHCATNIMFLYYHTQKGLEKSDDRLFKKKK